MKKVFWWLIFILIVVGVVLDMNFISYQLGHIFGNAKTERDYGVIPDQEPTIPADTLVIPSLAVNVPVVYVKDDTEAAFQAGLQNGVVHYPGTADPGKNGNCYIFGHSSDYLWSKGSYKTIFAPLPTIAIGAQIKLTDKDGQLYTYQVIKSYSTAANDVSVLSQDTAKPTLTLQTSYPLGTALKRWIVVAELK